MNNDTFQWTDLLACEWAGYLEEQLKVKSIMDMQSILFQWKQSKTPPKKDRIVVVRIQDITYSSSNHNTLFTTTSRINPDKFEAIKEAIERVLNDEGDESKIYTKEDHDILIEAAQSAAFNAAREPYCATAMGQRPKYWTFQDYLNHQRDKK